MSDQQNVGSEVNGAADSVAGAGQGSFPSAFGLVCPKCQKDSLKILGTKGAKGKAAGIGMAFGAVGNLVASSMSKNNFTLQPVQYQCNACKGKFETLPLVAGPEEVLEEPCTVHFARLSSFVGMAVNQDVWINGVKVATVGNGKSVTFQTFVRHNVIFVTDQYGVAFKDDYKFEAQSGQTVEVRFKRKFQ